jgi:hypothetical protein
MLGLMQQQVDKPCAGLNETETAEWLAIAAYLGSDDDQGIKSDGKSRHIFPLDVSPLAIDFVGRFTRRSGSERRDRTTRGAWP